MKKIFMMLALSTTFFVAPAAHAQSVDPACMTKNTDGTETVDMKKCPDGKTIGAASGQSTTTAPAASDTATTATDAAKTTTGSMIIAPDVLSSGKIISANDFIGKTVYSSANENIGEVNDLILSDNGNVRGVILGVGGFLGMGEKDVAVDMNSVTMTPDGDSMKLTMNATKEMLTSAPQYDRVKRVYMQ